MTRKRGSQASPAAGATKRKSKAAAANDNAGSRDDNAQEPVAAIIAHWKRERPDLDFEPMLLFASLARAYFGITTHIDQLVADHGLTRGMFDVLATLRRAGPPYSLTPKQLSASLLLSGAGMTNRLDRLEALKLTVRRPEPSDRRSLQIKLTDKGLKLVDRMLPGVLERQRLAFRFGAQNGRQLTKLLTLMNERAAADGQPLVGGEE
jgi:DNA-binding MarR family transcriptional regulator